MNDLFRVTAVILALGFGFSIALNVNYSQQLESRDSRIDALTNQTKTLEQRRTSLQEDIDSLERENARLRNYSLVNISQAIATGLEPEEYEDMAEILSNFTFNRDAGNEALHFGDVYYQSQSSFVEAATAYNLAETYYARAQTSLGNLQQFIQNEEKQDDLQAITTLYSDLQQLAARYEQLMYAYEDDNSAEIPPLEAEIQRIKSSIAEQREKMQGMEGLLSGYLGRSTDGVAT